MSVTCEQSKQKGMVLHQEGTPTSATAPAGNHPPTGLLVPRRGQAGEGKMERSSTVTSEEADMYPSKESVATLGGFPAVKCPTSLNPHPENLSPDIIRKGIRVTLDNNSMWNEFFRCKTEMILTKQGSRMFPYCRFRISGLQPSKKYCLIMDIQPLDNSRYKWTGKSWQVAGKAEGQVKSKPFAHPESPSTGQHWMQNPVSFYKLKLTNATSEQEGNTILHPMHRYSPRLHVVQTDKAVKDIKLNGPCVVTFSFPQTEFVAVTAYQNSRFAQLKVDYNPFAKGLKEDGSSSLGLKLKLNSSKDSHKTGGTTAGQHHPVKESLKCLLANHKSRSSKVIDSKPPVSSDLKNSTSNGDQSAAQVPEKSLCCSQPAQKLFSELIREAHVSLKRCNLEQLDVRAALESKREDVSKKDKTHSEPSSVKNCGTPLMSKRRGKEERHPSNVHEEVTNTVSVPLVSQKTSGSNRQPTPIFPSEGNVKQHKRPAPLPLPALALFLKQHSTKCKKSKNKPGSPPLVLSSEAQSSAEEHLPSDHPASANGPVKGLTDDLQPSGHATADIHPPGTAAEEASQPPGPSCSDAAANIEPKEPETDDHLAPFSASENPDSDAAVSDGACSPASPLDTVLDALNSPQTLTVIESSMLPSASSAIKLGSVIPVPECSSFGFESLSPASSPEPLPFELDSTTSDTTVRAVPPEELLQNVDSTPTVLKWHTVLPPPVPYIDSSYTTFESTSQPSLISASSPLLPSTTPTHMEPQTLESSTSMALVDPTLSFQQSDQSLPFPGELSPLALQLPLSPTFSSLGGDGLSPTPSITDLVNFFSTDDDLGIGVEFSSSEAAVVTCPSPNIVETNAHKPPQLVQTCPTKKPCESKRLRRRRPANMDMDQKVDNSNYTSMQPNLEEVEEQLFISFTSKEALKLHIADPPEDQTTPECARPPPADTLENVNNDVTVCWGPADGSVTISSCEKILLRDLKTMRHKQVIHPVLQEVGLKMNLLDPSLAIDLQYLGVHLPIPPPGASQEPVTLELPPPQGFVSRTGKTTDVTQIKGWREKFTGSEAPPTSASATPEAGPSSDPPKRNLSAFCSDMLDEYLETEGKLIDERAASFSQPVVEPVLYELPARSSSYVRTLDSVLKKPAASSPTSDLISGFIPPSKRPKHSLKDTKTSSKERKLRGPKKVRLRPEPAAEPSLAEPNLVPKQLSPAPPLSEYTAPVAEPLRSTKHQKRKVRFNRTGPLSLSPQTATFKRRRKLKPRSSCQTLSPSRSTAYLPQVSGDLAPLESDSELVAGAHQGAKDGRPVMTRALLRQKDLEDGVVWEGRPRTSITNERAAIALTSLFTLMGFVSDNPTAPVQLLRRQAPSCLNDFCRLGCVCSSLAHCSRVSHCGRPRCMFGCSCLKQKVVLLKNLDGSDSSPSHHGNTRRRRRRRMKMAYVLKEAESVSQPAERVRTLWRRDAGDSDPDPTTVPADVVSRLRSSESRDDGCARVRGYSGKRESWKQTDVKKPMKPKHSDLPLKEAQTRAPSPPAAAPSEPASKLSKSLVVIAECKWTTDTDCNHVMRRLCEAMALDRLREPFWIREYLISPVSQTVGASGDGCIHYKVRITKPREEHETPAVPPKPAAAGNQRKLDKQGHLRQGTGEAEGLEAWQWEITEEEKPQEDWQREVEEGDVQEEAGSALPRMDEGKMKRKEKKKKRVSLALPFLTGISPAGFLSARRRLPGGADHRVQVNGKLYPLAKIQLGKMGALHPANRLAAYLTGRVGSSRKQIGPCSSSAHSSKSEPTPQTSSLASSTLTAPDTTPPQPPPSTTAAPSATELNQSCDQLTAGAAGAMRTKVVAVKVYPNPVAGGSLVTVTSSSSAPATASHSSVVRPMVPRAGPTAVLGPGVRPAPLAGQRMVLRPVHTTSGVQYYRIPNGKLVQLLPISKLKAVNAAPPAPKGVTIENQPQASPPAPSPLSGLQRFSVTPRPNPLVQGSGFLSEKTTCTFKILPSDSNKGPVFISCSKLPPLPHTPGATATRPLTLLKAPSRPPANLLNLISHEDSEGQGTELRDKTVKVSEDSVRTAGLSAPPPPPPSHPCAEPELASDLMDLDIVCVDNEPTQSTEGAGLTGSSGEETENSSDFGGESCGEEGEETTTNQRHVQNLLERRRRGKMMQMFKDLRRVVGLKDDRASKVSTLIKAKQVIQELRLTEAHLAEKKRRLMKRRALFLSIITPTGKQTQMVPKTLEDDERHSAVSPLRAPVGGGAPECDRSTANMGNDDIMITSSSVQLQTLQVPPATAPPSTSVQTPVLVSQRVLQRAQTCLAPPSVSHSAPVVKNRPKTMPNILSRSKRPVTTTSSSVLTVTDTSPGEQRLSPLMVGPLVLQTTTSAPGVASVTLNTPNPQAHLGSLPHLSTGGDRLVGCPSESNVLHPPQPPLVASAGPELPSSSSTLGPGPRTDCGGGVGAEGPETRADDDTKSPSSLDAMVSVNQQTVPLVTAAGVSYGVAQAVGGAKELDCDDIVARETEDGGLQGQTETGPTHGNSTGDALLPPPLLHMKVGGSKVADAASSDRATTGRGRGEGAMAWRPMPRLVPLGLKGNPPS